MVGEDMKRITKFKILVDISDYSPVEIQKRYAKYSDITFKSAMVRYCQLKNGHKVTKKENTAKRWVKAIGKGHWLDLME